MTNKRSLGIDYGEARIGIAKADDLGMLAHPYETIKVQGDFAKACQRIKEIVNKESIEVIVLGLPKSLDGVEKIAAQNVRKFGSKLMKLLPPSCKLIWIDERMTTASAQKALQSSGRNTKQSRPIIDQVAAQMILQIYLDREGFKTSFKS